MTDPGALQIDWEDEVFDGRMPDFACVCQHRPDKNFVFPVDLKRTVLDCGAYEIEEIARVHLACVVRQLRWKVFWSYDPNAVVIDRFAGHSQLAVAAHFGSDIDDDRSRCHPFNRGAIDNAGCLFTRDGCRSNNCIGAGNVPVENFCLLCLFLIRKFAGVTSFRFRADPGGDKAATQRLNLFARRLNGWHRPRWRDL